MGQIKRTLGLAQEYMRWNIRSPLFPASVLLYALILFISIYADYLAGSNEGAFYYLDIAYISRYESIAFMLCAVPSALNLCREYKCRNFILVYSRAGKAPYAVALCLSSFLTAFLAAAMGGIIFLGIVAFKYPMAGGNMFILQSEAGTLKNGGLLAQDKYFLYYFLTVSEKSCFIGMMAVITVFSSIFLIEPLLSIVFPMLAHSIVCDAMVRLDMPRLLNPSFVFNTGNYNFRYIHKLGYPENAAENFSVISCVYPFAYVLVCVLIFTVLTNILLSKTQEGKTMR